MIRTLAIYYLMYQIISRELMSINTVIILQNLSWSKI